MNILELVIEEIKCSYKMILLGIAIAITIFSVVIVFYNLTGYIMPAISRQYDKDLEDGISVQVQRLDLKDSDILSELGAENLILNSNDSNKFYDASLKIYEKNIEITEKYYKWITKEDIELLLTENGIEYEDFNNSENAIIYCSKEDMGSFEIGDILSLYLKNGKVVSDFKVQAVIQNDEITTPYAILPSKEVIQKMDEKGISIAYNFECVISKASKYVEFKKELSSYGAYCSCDFDEMLELVSTLKLVFRILAIIFVVISVFVIVTISIININTREKFLVLQKVLGSTDRKIIFIYMIILEMQIILADILGCLLGVKFTGHLTDVVHSLYAMEYNIANVSVISIFLKCLNVSNIAILPFFLVIKKIVNSKDIISVINNKD